MPSVSATSVSFSHGCSADAELHPQHTLPLITANAFRFASTVCFKMCISMRDCRVMQHCPGMMSSILTTCWKTREVTKSRIPIPVMDGLSLTSDADDFWWKCMRKPKNWVPLGDMPAVPPGSANAKKGT